MLVGALALAASASAQHPSIGAPPPRPLPLRLAQADAVAIASVEEVGVGRIRFGEARGLLGGPPPRFEVKRAPSSPPDVAPGDRLLLLLRGARSPYLLVDRPDEIPRIRAASEEGAWSEALGGLQHALAADATSSQARVLARWLEAEGSSLQREAAISLADEAIDVGALPDERFERLAELAAGAEDATLRRAAARAAVRNAAGRRHLLARLPGEDPQVLITGLVASLSLDGADARTIPACTDVALRALRDPHAELREAALRSSAALARDRRVRAEIVRIAAEDPETPLRDLARRLMHATADSPSGG